MMDNEEKEEANDPAMATVVSGLGETSPSVPQRLGKGQFSLQCYA
jgi:hypothetical protein